MNKEMKQCAFLSSEGKRCRKRSALKLQVHLDSEIYDYPSWVEVNLCAEHFTHYGGSFNPSKQQKITKHRSE